MEQRKTKTGIIVAMKAELERLLPLLEDMKAEEANGYRFYCGHMGQREVVVTQCGIGKVNAAVGALTLIERYAPELVVNTGIAGGTGHGAEVLDVVVATEVAYHDVWCGPGEAPGAVQGLPATFVCDGVGMLRLAEAERRLPQLRRGLLASGDSFISSAEQLQQVLRVQPRAVAVDMEGGAIAQVCHMRGVPFAAVRVVSDTPGVEHHQRQYLDFFVLAPESTFEALKIMLNV